MADGVDGTFYGGSLADMIHGGTGNDTIYGRGGADRLAGNDGNDTYVYADTTLFGNTTDSTVNNDANAPVGYDTVTVGNGDIFDFGTAVDIVNNGVFATGTSLPATGELLLSELNSVFSSEQFPVAGFREAMVIGFTSGEEFLVIDQDGNDTIDATDTIILLNSFDAIGTLGLNGGDVVIGGVPV
jgi:RTX calcium-binding nonapeptide repeat (4 copies)